MRLDQLFLKEDKVSAMEKDLIDMYKGDGEPDADDGEDEIKVSKRKKKKKKLSS